MSIACPILVRHTKVICLVPSTWVQWQHISRVPNNCMVFNKADLCASGHGLLKWWSCMEAYQNNKHKTWCSNQISLCTLSWSCNVEIVSPHIWNHGHPNEPSCYDVYANPLAVDTLEEQQACIVCSHCKLKPKCIHACFAKLLYVVHNIAYLIRVCFYLGFHAHLMA